MKRLAILLTVVALALHARPGDACTDEGESGLGIYAPLPALGTSAPTNTQIWLPQALDWNAPAIDPATVVITQGTTTVAADVHRMIVAGDFERDVWVFTPTAPLSPGAAVVVTIGSEIATQFMVEPTADLEPPAMPVIRKVEVDSGYFGGFSCGDASRVVVTVADSGTLLVLAEGSGTALPDNALAVTNARQLGAIGLPEGDHTLRLLAIDLAGNTTVARVPDFTIPAEQSGCNAASGAGGWAITAIVGMLALSARRRRRSWLQRSRAGASVTGGSSPSSRRS